MPSANHTLEITLELEGTIQPGQSQSHNDPGHDRFVEDSKITDIAAEIFDWKTKRYNQVSLTKGFTPDDWKSPTFLKLLSNLSEVCADDIDEAILAAED